MHWPPARSRLSKEADFFWDEERISEEVSKWR